LPELPEDLKAIAIMTTKARTNPKMINMSPI
jgi:hypothetical protein